MSDSVRPILQIAGTVVGGMVGGPIGAGIGGAIGGAVGGAVAPTNVGEGPRLEDLKVISSTYGKPIPLVYGTQNRFAGNIIWSSELQEDRDTREVSKGNEVTEYSYSVDLAIALCEGPITNISKIWANGKQLWSGAYFSQEVTLAGEDYTAADANADDLETQAASCGLDSDPDCAEIYAKATAARAQADAAYARKTAAEAAQTDYQTTGTDWSFTSELAPGAIFRFYPGTMTQGVDPTIEADKGSGNAPAYLGICYLVIENLQLADFGNRIPNLEFEVLSPNTTVRAALIDINTRSGLQDYDYSVSLRLDDDVDGYVIGQQMTSLAAMMQLEQAFFFDTVEQFGQIRHVKRGGHIKATFDPGDLAARESGGGVTQPIITKRTHDEALPKVATVTYRDANRDYQSNTQRAQRLKGSSDHVLNAELAITMTDAYARQVVDRMLFEPYVARVSMDAKAHPKFDFLTPADVVGVPVAGSVLPFRLISIVRGANGLVEFHARMDDPFIYTGSQDGQAATIETAPTLANSDTFIYCFNAPVLDPTESVTGFTWAADADGPAWRGGNLYRAANGVTFNVAGTVSRRNITGTVSAATSGGSDSLWDRETTIQVTLHYESHTLSSVSESEVLNGANAFWLGDADGVSGEVIQFATATLISSDPKTYDLSDLLRGRRATEYAIDAHGANEIFVMLESAYYRSIDYGQSDLNAERTYKGVSVYQDVDEVITVQDFTNTGEKAMPRSVVHVVGSRDGSDNITATFRRRIRGFNQEPGNGTEALDEATEAYEIDILDGVTVVRTIEVSSESFSYSAAQQTTDGLTPGDPVSGNIYQIGAYGRGHARSFTI